MTFALVLAAALTWASSRADTVPALGEIPALRPALPVAPESGVRVVDPDGRIPGVQARIEALKTLRAGFVQVNEYGFAALADTFAGELHVRMPDDFVLHYSDPAGQFILSDGATLSMYVPENAQVVRGRITRAGEDLNFFRLILGYLRTSDAEVRNMPGGFGIHLVPRFDPVIREMDLVMDPDLLLPTSFSMVDVNGNRSSYRLSDAEVDREIPGTFFRVQVPDGVEFVDP